MSYLKVYDKLIEVDFEPYRLTKTICDAGYLKTLDAGAIVRIGETWTNFYGRWTSIYDLEGRCYDIHPYEVENVTEKLETKETIEELCDEFIVVHENGNHVIQKKVGNGLKDMDKDYPEYLKRNNQTFYGAIWTDKGLIYVVKMNDKGELELL